MIDRDADTLSAVPLEAGARSTTITDEPGNVMIRGKVVFNFANVDWTTNLGDLSIGPRKAGTHAIGKSLYSEGLVEASPDGSTVVYTVNATPTSVDLMIPPAILPLQSC